MPMIPEAKETDYRGPALEGVVNQILYQLDGEPGLFRLVAANSSGEPNGVTRFDAVLCGRSGKKSIRAFERDPVLWAAHEDPEIVEPAI